MTATTTATNTVAPTTVIRTTTHTATSTVSVTDRGTAPTVTRTAAPSPSKPLAGIGLAVVDDPGVILGPNGYQGLRLGMSFAQAAATGNFVSTPTGDGCETWTATMAQPIESVVLSKQKGVVAIFARNRSYLTTPDGAGLGITAAQLQFIYPSFNETDAHHDDGVKIPVPGHAGDEYEFGFDSDNRIVSFALMTDDHGCFE